MIRFVLVSAFCQAVFFIAYKYWLEPENMPRFNRWFLLGSLVFSLAIPFITIDVVTTVIPQSTTAISLSHTPAQPAFPGYLTWTAWSIYLTGAFIMLARFGKNLFALRQKISNHQNVKTAGVTYVLLDEKIVPHTFLHYIFVNKDDYNKGRLESELLAHEQAHATQKHTFDILLAEMARVVLWFSPMPVFYKKAIRLNHEFLADQAVLHNHSDVISYQNLLLSKAAQPPSFALESSLYFSVTHKRFIMMTKPFSAIRANLKKSAVAVIVLALFGIFCLEAVAQEKPKKQPAKASAPAYPADAQFDITYPDGTRLNKTYGELTEKEKTMIPPPPPAISKDGKPVSPPKLLKWNFNSNEVSPVKPKKP